ncbi:MAG: IS3 family transposase [Acidobacteria bacterium]|nr:IS3 family transposase [Acidobacteriota bacterium]
MSRSKHTEAQMIAAVKQMEAGRKAEDVAREVGVSAHTMYAWKSKYGGMDVSEAQEAKRLRDENTRLRKLVADLSLDKEALQSVIGKKRMELAAMKASVEHIRKKFAFTERRACRLLLVPVSSYRYKPSQNDDGLRERLVALAREKPRYGYRRLHVLLGREGEQVNHKRVHRIYREAGLALRRKKRKHCVRLSTPLGTYTAANQEWALDFVHDAVACGRSIRVLNVIDAYTRESLAMEVDTSFAGPRVTRVLDQIIAERGLPRAIRCDNGPELTSRHFLAWALDRKVDLIHIQPGKPTQNGYVESFNGKLREECLRVSWFQNLFEARRIIANWRHDYNERRPHSSLNYLTPAEFSAKTSRGKDADSVRLENAHRVSHFPTAAAAS